MGYLIAQVEGRSSLGEAGLCSDLKLGIPALARSMQPFAFQAGGESAAAYLFQMSGNGN